MRMPACASKRKCQKLQEALVSGIVHRIIQEHDAPVGLAGVLLVDGRDQRRRYRRTVALHHETDLVVDGLAQLYEARLAAALAIEHDQLQRMHAVSELHAALHVHALDAEAQIALDHRASIGERAGHTFDQRELDRREFGGASAGCERPCRTCERGALQQSFEAFAGCHRIRSGKGRSADHRPPCVRRAIPARRIIDRTA